MTYKPSIAIPPGWSLKETMEYRNISVKKICKDLGLKEGFVKLLLTGGVPIGVDLAKVLNDYFDIDAQFWLNLQNGYANDLYRLAKKHESPTKTRRDT